jgi:hypothetical protein
LGTLRREGCSFLSKVWEVLREIFVLGEYLAALGVEANRAWVAVEAKIESIVRKDNR